MSDTTAKRNRRGRPSTRPAIVSPAIQLVVAVMEREGITQMELARRLGVEPSYVNKYMRGTDGIAGPRIAFAARALDAMGYTLVLDAVPNEEGEQ